jgi:hypothetical protein
MTDELDTWVEFDELVAIALAELASGAVPAPAVRSRLMARLRGAAALRLRALLLDGHPTTIGCRTRCPGSG